MSFPALYTVRTAKFSEGPDRDPRGVLIKHWAEPVPQFAIGWSYPSMKEPAVAGHDRVVVDCELLVPLGFDAGPHDRVTLPASPGLPEQQFEVIGYPEDFTHGPWGFAPGYVINLKRAEG